MSLEPAPFTHNYRHKVGKKLVSVTFGQLIYKSMGGIFGYIRYTFDTSLWHRKAAINDA